MGHKNIKKILQCHWHILPLLEGNIANQTQSQHLGGQQPCVTSWLLAGCVNQKSMALTLCLSFSGSYSCGKLYFLFCNNINYRAFAFKSVVTCKKSHVTFSQSQCLKTLCPDT